MANGLMKEVAGLTGLPPDWVEQELSELLAEQGIKPDELTMDGLRAVMAALLEGISDQINAEQDSESAAVAPAIEAFVESGPGSSALKTRAPAQ